MSRRQLVALFLCMALPFAAGNAQLGLLSVYLTRLGVDSASIGNYVALIFLALAAGTILGGWLSDRFQRRKAILIALTALMVPLSLLMSQTTQVWQLIVLLVIVWLLGGIAIAMVNILAGLFAADDERGKIFGLLGVAVNVGSMLGGMILGFVVQRWGFTTLFVVVAALDVITPIAGCFLEDKAIVPERSRAASTAQIGLILGLSFYLILVASLLVNMAGAFVNLGRPLVMDKAGFDSAAIASVITVGAAVSIPVPFLLGWLSDRLGRYRLIVLSYLLAGASVALVGVSIMLWHFWFAALLGAGINAGNAVTSALVTDLVPPQGLGRALSWLNATGWVGGVVGFAIVGYAIQGIGLTSTFMVGGILPVLGILLLVRIRSFQLAPVAG